MPLSSRTYCRRRLGEWRAVVVFIPIVYREKSLEKFSHGRRRAFNHRRVAPRVMVGGGAHFLVSLSYMQIIITTTDFYAANTRAQYYIILRTISRSAIVIVPSQCIIQFDIVISN